MYLFKGIVTKGRKSALRCIKLANRLAALALMH
jgi:hypothetical protein